jgi:glutamate-5-semialdehyde dehydrogenase
VTTVDRTIASTSLGPTLAGMGRAARAAQEHLRLATAAEKDRALAAAADAIIARTDAILAANAIDLAAAKEAERPAAFLDRLMLSPDRLAAIAGALRAIAALADPVGRVMSHWTRPNGLAIERVATPLGVIGIIFESRPNVTADAGGLCLKAGNAAILRAGSESLRSALAIHAALVRGLVAAGLPETCIQVVPVPDREAVGLMLAGLDGAIDVIVPRGGKSLVARVQSEARVPVFAHLEGICHVYVDKAADLEMAKRIAVNSKLRRTGVCGAAETLLIDKAAPERVLIGLIKALIAAGCAVRGDASVLAVDPRVTPATEADWSTEHLDAVITAGVVDGVAGAVAHIARYGSEHTESIVTEDAAAAERFLGEVDSAIVLWNASTQFADGAEFGMGAEIGIATGRLHARGPVGVEQLTSFKYKVRGSGQIRP